MFIDKKALMDELSEFYKKYSFDQKFLDLIFQIYIDIGNIIENYILQIKDSKNISTMEAYRTYSYASVVTAGATYTYEDLLFDKYVIDKLSLADKSFEERKNIWLNATDDIKIEILLRKNYFISIFAEKYLNSENYKIIDMEVYNLKNEKLERNTYFILRDNKIFLINDAALPTFYNSKLILKNIKVDYNYAENFLGKHIKVPYTEAMSKPEYRDFIQMVIYAALNGPKIKSLNDTFNLLSKDINVQIMDMYNATDSKKRLWDGTVNSAILTPFDFLVDLTSDFFKNEDKLNLFLKFLNVIKPTDSNYVINWTKDIRDIISEARSGADLSGRTIILLFDSEDTDVKFDNNIPMDTKEIIVEGGDVSLISCEVSLITFPEIPLLFTAVLDADIVNIAFKDNAAGITRYEVLRNGEVILTATGDGTGNMINLVDDTFSALSAGEYSYYARSVYEGTETKYSYESAISTIIKE